MSISESLIDASSPTTKSDAMTETYSFGSDENITPYKVLIVPDPRLKDVASPVETITDETRLILDRMVKTMMIEDGVGLAATQVGITQRLIVMNIPDETEHDHGADGHCEHCHIYKLVNPEITERSETKRASKEGCLSIPNQYGDVMRHEWVKVKYLDENGQEQSFHAEGLLSDCIQHEIDHLDGILFIDYLSGMKRRMMIQKAKKAAILLGKQRQKNL